MPQFAPIKCMADFENASVKGFKVVYGDQVTVSGCWFHYAQAVSKKAKKLGLTVLWRESESVKKCIRVLMCLPLLPASDIIEGLQDVETQLIVTADARSLIMLNALCAYIRRQWITKTSVGPERMSVVGNRDRTNNGVESFHAALQRRIKVSHPNLFTFLDHLQQIAMTTNADVVRLEAGVRIRRPKKKTQFCNDKRLRQITEQFACGNFTKIAFLSAASHCADNMSHVVAHISADSEDASTTEVEDNEDNEIIIAPPAMLENADEAPDINVDNSQTEDITVSMCQVCLIAPTDRLILVPCGHAKFCAQCVGEIRAQGLHCPLCRAQIDLVINVFV